MSKKNSNLTENLAKGMVIGSVVAIAAEARVAEASILSDFADAISDMFGGGNSNDGGGNNNSQSDGYTSFTRENVTYSQWSNEMRDMGMTVEGNYASRTDGSWSAFTPRSGESTPRGDSDSGGGSTTYTSCPFLLVWDGKKYVHENDFLFGKPGTSFANERVGLSTYAAGIGGDTYVLSDTLRLDDQGKLRLQIREIEPEQSFIDRFALYAVDLNENEILITDGNLSDSYVFDLNACQSLKNQTIHHYQLKAGVVKEASVAYSALGEFARDSEIVLEKNDELIIKIPVTKEQNFKDVYLLLDSYYRDWTLGNRVPLSWYDTLRLRAQLVVGRFGVAAIASLLAYGSFNVSEKTVSLGGATIVHADDVYNSKSLVVTAEISGASYYLQTIFPRFLRYTQEVVRIPGELLEAAVGEMLTLRVRATKKHNVRAAFAFTAIPRKPEQSLLLIESAVKGSVDLTSRLVGKTGDLVRIVAGEVIDLALSDLPRQEGKHRKYVLKAEGFYTTLPATLEAAYKKNIYPKLALGDRKLLRTLRMRA